MCGTGRHWRYHEWSAPKPWKPGGSRGFGVPARAFSRRAYPRRMTEPLIHRYEPTDPRLGRRVFHDPRSLAYAHPVLPKSAIQTVEWTRRIPILDQGRLGSCFPLRHESA